MPKYRRFDAYEEQLCGATAQIPMKCTMDAYSLSVTGLDAIQMPK